MRKLRLLVFEECNRHCPMCVNKQWDLEFLPVETDYSGYDEIILTGGEPMLYPAELEYDIDKVRKQADAGTKIYLHTAKVDDLYASLCILDKLDGITVTIHEAKDITDFEMFDAQLFAGFPRWRNKSLKLCVFKDIEMPKMLCPWDIHEIEWLEYCPLPPDEVFKKFS